MIETGIEKAIKILIFSKGGWITKVQSGSVMKSYRDKFGKIRTHKINLADEGTPDMLGCLNGIHLAIEVKKDEKEIKKWAAYPNGLRGKPVKYNSTIEAQKRTADRIAKNGGFFAVVCSAEDLEKDLKSVGILT